MPYKNIEVSRIKNKERYAQMRFDAIKSLGNRCSHCKNDDWEVLQFDHITPVLRKTRGESGNRIFPGIIKSPQIRNLYQLLCANCHMKKSRAENARNGLKMRGENHPNWKGGYYAQKIKSDAWYKEKGSKLRQEPERK